MTEKVFNNEEVNPSQVVINIAKVPPSKVSPGDFMILKVRGLCSSTYNLMGEIIRIIDQDGLVLKENKLVIPNGAAYETDPIVVRTPVMPGDYTWKAVFTYQEKEGVINKEVSVPFTFSVRPQHATSIQIWDADSPAVIRTKFNLKAGVRCSANCKLTDNKIEIYNQEGFKVATEQLGDDPWPGTSALYWTEVELETPDTDGCYTWQVKFPKPDSEIPHLETCSSFSLRVVNQPESTITVSVIDKETKSPINNAIIMLHPYRTKTNEKGSAKLEVIKGKYQLYISGGDYETFKMPVKVTDSLTIKAELVARAVMLEDG